MKNAGFSLEKGTGRKAQRGENAGECWQAGRQAGRRARVSRAACHAVLAKHKAMYP